MTIWLKAISVEPEKSSSIIFFDFSPLHLFSLLRPTAVIFLLNRQNVFRNLGLKFVSARKKPIHIHLKAQRNNYESLKKSKAYSYISLSECLSDHCARPSLAGQSKRLWFTKRSKKKGQRKKSQNREIPQDLKKQNSKAENKSEKILLKIILYMLLAW